MSETNALPHFVRKQVDVASAEFLNRFSAFPIEAEVRGCRVLLIEKRPHPMKDQPVRLPMALLDFKDDLWHLLFRGSAGGWQPVPNDAPSISIQEKFDAIFDDVYRIFWRQ